MAEIIADLEDAFVKYVRERIPMNQWKRITCSGHILDGMDEDSENELKDHFWNQLVASVRWYNVLDDVERMCENVIDSDSETENESDKESTDSE